MRAYVRGHSDGFGIFVGADVAYRSAGLLPGERLVASVEGQDVEIRVDIGFGDAVEPEIERRVLAPFLADDPPASVRAYPAELVIAEKVQTILVRFPVIAHRLKDLLDVVDRAKAITSRIDLVHCNDSRDAFGSGADRHANLGAGQIDPDLLLAVVAAAGAPVVCETPGGLEGQAEDIAWLREHLPA